MNKTLINIYNVSFIVSIILFINLYQNYSGKLYEQGWIYKIILMICAGLSITYSLYYDNNINNTNILPLFLYLNIFVLIYIILINTKKYNLYNIVSILIILYLLSTINHRDIIIKNGKLLNPNKEWIYKYIVILSVYFLLIDDKILTTYSKLGSILLLLYPLLFSLDEYFVHRVYSLCFIVAIKWYININYAISL